MSDVLYERYKEALKLGHLAVRRGLHEAALVAYREAAAIAPDRPMPHVGLGHALRLLHRHEAAIASYAAALERTPGDEAALSGQAESWTALGRRAEAADALDRLADVQEAAGRLDDALASTRRALELAEAKARRRRLRRLGGDDALSGAAPGVVIHAGAALADEAAERLEAGDRTGALEGFRAAIAAHRRAGRVSAALDACSHALAVAPDDSDTHLTLVDLYLELGWRSPAVEKLALLARLADLDGNVAVRERLCRIVSERLEGEPRLTGLCA